MLWPARPIAPTPGVARMQQPRRAKLQRSNRTVRHRRGKTAPAERSLPWGTARLWEERRDGRQGCGTAGQWAGCGAACGRLQGHE